MPQYEPVKDAAGRPVVEYLESSTPLVLCVDEEKNEIWRPAQDALPPPPPRPTGTPAYDPRRDEAGLVLVGAVIGLVIGSLIMVAALGLMGHQPWAPHTVWAMAILGGVVGYRCQRRRVARWDEYVRSADGLVLEDPLSVMRRTYAHSTLWLVLLLGWVGLFVGLLLPRGSTRPGPRRL